MKYYFSSIAILLACQAPQACSQDSQKALQPFRSELWQREFRQEDDKDAPKDSVPEQEDAPNAGSSSKTKQNIAGDSGRDAAFPGQMGLDELRESTPIAEWQVDDGADRAAGSTAFRDEVSAWQLSHAGKTEDELTAEMAEGPTITTYLVGLMACIVVVGALFTGREY